MLVPLMGMTMLHRLMGVFMGVWLSPLAPLVVMSMALIALMLMSVGNPLVLVSMSVLLAHE